MSTQEIERRETGIQRQDFGADRVQAPTHLPVMTMIQAGERRAAVVAFIQRIMVAGEDFGTIPGTNKPTLLKSGAEKLANFFGLEPFVELIESERDWTGERHGGEPFFHFEYRYELRKGSQLVGVGIGSCNSWESKYRWRKAERECPACGAPAIIKGKAEFGGGWVCFKKKGGCGAKFADGDAAIEGQQVGRVPNPDIFDQVNTFQKMAKKRAQIDATLNATSASEFYTQDMEDLSYEHTAPYNGKTRDEFAAGRVEEMQGTAPVPVADASAEDPALAEKLAAVKVSMPETVKVIQAHKYEIEAATGNDGPYYEILGKYGLEHANSLKGVKRSTVRQVITDLHEYVAKVTAEPPPAAETEDLGVSDDDIPPAFNGAADV